MNRDDKRARDLAKLEAAQQRVRQRLAHEQERIDQRFERLRQKVDQKYGQTTAHQERIIEAALELLKEDGLNNLSLRKLARKLDMQAPALYWHFQSKEVLIDYMAEAILQQELHSLQPRSEDQSWQDWLIDHMSSLRKAMLAYPDGARVVAGAHLSPAVTLAKSFETGLVSLTTSGIDMTTARQVMVTATNYTFGYVIEEQAAPTPEQLADFDLESFLKPYPMMASAINDLDRGPGGRRKDFLRGLDYIIQGSSKV